MPFTLRPLIYKYTVASWKKEFVLIQPRCSKMGWIKLLISIKSDVKQVDCSAILTAFNYFCHQYYNQVLSDVLRSLALTIYGLINSSSSLHSLISLHLLHLCPYLYSPSVHTGCQSVPPHPWSRSPAILIPDNPTCSRYLVSPPAWTFFLDLCISDSVCCSLTSLRTCRHFYYLVWSFLSLYCLRYTHLPACSLLSCLQAHTKNCLTCPGLHYPASRAHAGHLLAPFPHRNQLGGPGLHYLVSLLISCHSLLVCFLVQNQPSPHASFLNNF